MDAASKVNLSAIRTKLANGEKLSSKDLLSLEPLHDALYDRDGRVVDWASDNDGTTERDLNQPIEDIFLEYLDRSILDGRRGHAQRDKPSESQRLPQLVRYVGKS